MLAASGQGGKFGIRVVRRKAGGLQRYVDTARKLRHLRIGLLHRAAKLERNRGLSGSNRRRSLRPRVQDPVIWHILLHIFSVISRIIAQANKTRPGLPQLRHAGGSRQQPGQRLAGIGQQPVDRRNRLNRRILHDQIGGLGTVAALYALDDKVDEGVGSAAVEEEARGWIAATLDYLRAFGDAQDVAIIQGLVDATIRCGMAAVACWRSGDRARADDLIMKLSLIHI